ncbi:MAG: hypothetical protein H6R01_811 [Burkholderiaceae bacterium]|nr:hypothetical protein [Burkholderiaceae bacterium]
MKKTTTPQEQNPVLIAKEVFRLLGQRRTSPTPEAYRELYYEVAGMTDPMQEEQQKESAAPEIDPEALTVLNSFARKLTTAKGDVADLGYRIHRAAKTNDWEDYGKALSLLFDKYLKSPSGGAPSGISLAPVLGESEQLASLRELLVRTLSFAVASLLQDAPDLAADAETIGNQLKAAQTDDDFVSAASRLKQLCYRIEMKAGNIAEQQEILLRLFNLLLDNIGELLEDDSWLRGQITVIQNLVSGPLNYRTLEDAEISLKEVIFKQGQLKHSLNEARNTLKNMMMTFIDRLGEIAVNTGNYHAKMETYSVRISKAANIGELNDVLAEVMRETKQIQTEARSSRDQMMAARKEAEEAEGRIHDLEKRLEQMSELVREDALTGSLNRRGMEDAFEREAARSDRRNLSLCVALLDLDNFKVLNDTYGHYAGDQALIHLVRVVKETLRPTDVIARFGGEEFLILLPETKIEDAVNTLVRVQRALTRHFFLYKNEQILITFSAGVALRHTGEEQDAVVNRADRAMYQAKRAGKNRVFAAE